MVVHYGMCLRGMALAAVIAVGAGVAAIGAVVFGIRSSPTSRPDIMGQDCSISDQADTTALPLVFNYTLVSLFVFLVVITVVSYYRIWRIVSRKRGTIKSHSASTSANYHLPEEVAVEVARPFAEKDTRRTDTTIALTEELPTGKAANIQSQHRCTKSNCSFDVKTTSVDVTSSMQGSSLQVNINHAAKDRTEVFKITPLTLKETATKSSIKANDSSSSNPSFRSGCLYSSSNESDTTKTSEKTKISEVSKSANISSNENLRSSLGPKESQNSQQCRTENTEVLFQLIVYQDDSHNSSDKPKLDLTECKNQNQRNVQLHSHDCEKSSYCQVSEMKSTSQLVPSTNIPRKSFQFSKYAKKYRKTFKAQAFQITENQSYERDNPEVKHTLTGTTNDRNLQNITRNQLKANTDLPTHDVSSVSRKSGARLPDNSKKSRRTNLENAITRTAFLLTITFLVSYVPFFLISLTRTFDKNFDYTQDMLKLNVINAALRLYFTMPAISPVIFWASNLDFRTRVRAIFKKRGQA